jgi:hypothetical protein
LLFQNKSLLLFLFLKLKLLSQFLGSQSFFGSLLLKSLLLLDSSSFLPFSLINELLLFFFSGLLLWLLRDHCSK